MLGEITYLRWLREAFHRARYSLASSGAPPPPAELLTELLPDPIEAMAARPAVGPARLEAAVARRYQVPEPCVLATAGTTGGVFQVLAAHVEAGTPVVIETPTYGPLRQAARGLGARIVDLPRRRRDGFLPDPDELARHFANGARLALLTDPHNPSGVCLPEDRWVALREVAAAHGATLVVDEVYRELSSQVAQSAFVAGGPIVAVSSLTKAWGLGSLRAGWILAEPPLRRRLAAAGDALWPGGIEPSATVAAAVVGSRLGETLLTAAREHLDAVWPMVAATLAGRPGVAATGVRCHAFLDLGRPATSFAETLLATTGTLTVPGVHFGDPNGLRVAFFGPREEVECGLRHLTRALDALPPGTGGRTAPGAI